MNTDTKRKLAFDNWINALNSIRLSISGFVQACADPRLFHAVSNSTVTEIQPGVSREFVCAEIDRLYPEIDSMGEDLRFGSEITQSLEDFGSHPHASERALTLDIPSRIGSGRIPDSRYSIVRKRKTGDYVRRARIASMPSLARGCPEYQISLGSYRFYR
jgi:hypothetical protein